MDEKDRRGFAVGFVIFIGLGLSALVNPTFFEGYQSVGPSSFLKELAMDYWGRKMGIAMMVLGALALVGLYQTE